jgi:hypothetical protein
VLLLTFSGPERQLALPIVSLSAIQMRVTAVSRRTWRAIATSTGCPLIVLGSISSAHPAFAGPSFVNRSPVASSVSRRSAAR